MKQEKPKLTMIVTVRGDDPHLAGTLQRARDTAGAPVRLLVVFDGLDKAPEVDADEAVVLRTPRGCMAARHTGIQKATTPYIVVTDAHMAFPQDWANAVLAELQAHPKTVACARMQSVSGAFVPQAEGTSYTAARINWRAIEPVNGYATRKHYSAISAKWAAQKPGRIGAVMGAFYAFSRAWYREMAEPWEVGTGWGTDEEVISIASYLAGGDVRLMPIVVQHVYQVGGGVWRCNTDDVLGVWRNRFRVLHLFPFSAEDRGDLLAWLSMNALPTLTMGTDLSRPCVRRVIDRFADCGEALATYVQTYVDRPAVDQRDSLAKIYAANRTERPAVQVIHRQVEVCKVCNAADSFRVQHTEGNRQYCACNACGARAVRMNHGGQLTYGIGRYS